MNHACAYLLHPALKTVFPLLSLTQANGVNHFFFCSSDDKDDAALERLEEALPCVDTAHASCWAWVSRIGEVSRC